MSRYMVLYMYRIHQSGAKAGFGRPCFFSVLSMIVLLGVDGANRRCVWPYF